MYVRKKSGKIFLLLLGDGAVFILVQNGDVAKAFWHAG
jgi:hypothetical protein